MADAEHTCPDRVDGFGNPTAKCSACRAALPVNARQRIRQRILLVRIRGTSMKRDRIREQLLALIPAARGTSRMRKAELQENLAAVGAWLFPAPVPDFACKTGWEWLS